MTKDLTETVARAMDNAFDPDLGWSLPAQRELRAKAAIRAVIEALAAEAGPHAMVVFHRPFMSLADWLWASLPEGSDQ